MSLESSASLWDGISFWLIGVGAILAFVGTVAGWRARTLGRELAIEKTAIAARDKDASDRAIADANARAEEAKRAAAEANVKAEHEKLERLKLEQKIAPRRVSKDQQSSIGEALKPYRPSGHVLVFVSKEDVEIVLFAKELAVAMEGAGWSVRMAVKKYHNRIPVGVSVEMLKNISDKDIVVASALATVLRRSGIDDVYGPSVLDDAQGFDSQHSGNDLLAPIQVMIGEKVVTL
jgi:hypothetical protein